jgi:AcrR family transcriptional regulator
MATRTPTDYFEAALDLLAESGPPGVTIEGLCRLLGVTKGSFYHHFAGIPDFMGRLLAYWEKRGSDREALSVTNPSDVLALAKLTATWELHHGAESAIRALARIDPLAAEVQRRVDTSREYLLATTFAQVGIPKARATVLARMGIAILIGTQQREHPVDRRRLQDVFDEYQRWLEHSIVGEPDGPQLGESPHLSRASI